MIVKLIHILLKSKGTYDSTKTPHLAIALKKSFFDRAPLLRRSKNLNALKRKASRLTFDGALNCIF